MKMPTGDGGRRNGTGWLTQLRSWSRGKSEPVIGLALSGGFARGLAHVGAIRVLEQHHIPIHLIGGVSAGAIVASAYASGATTDEIARVGKAMRFRDVAEWKVSLMGLADSECMTNFLKRLLKLYRFEEMRIPLAVVATDLCTGKPVIFRDKGDVFVPVRASCAYPGLYQPVRANGRTLVDGAMSMEVPALALRKMGATRVISIALPMDGRDFDPRNMFQVINRCFQIMQRRTEWDWRKHSNAVIEPDVGGTAWDSFESADRLIETGEKAARLAMPRILSWFEKESKPALGSVKAQFDTL